MLADAGTDVITFTGFPKEHWKVRHRTSQC